MEVNANWLAEQVEGSEEYQKLQAKCDQLQENYILMANENAALREAMHNLRLAVQDAIADVRAIAEAQQ